MGRANWYTRGIGFWISRFMRPFVAFPKRRLKRPFLWSPQTSAHPPIPFYAKHFRKWASWRFEPAPNKLCITTVTTRDNFPSVLDSFFYSSSNNERELVLFFLAGFLLFSSFFFLQKNHEHFSKLMIFSICEPFFKLMNCFF